MFSEIETALIGEGYRLIAGVDEAGRGPLAGPVVAAAVIFEPGTAISGVADSKVLSPEKRSELYDIIRSEAAAFSIEAEPVEEIDRINIFRASLRAMSKAVAGLSQIPDYVVVDGRHPIDCSSPCQSIVKGDAKTFSIGAASILAKVTRDRIMQSLHEDYPEYGFDRHKGYATKQHRAAIEEYGVTLVHRRTFCKRYITPDEQMVFSIGEDAVSG